MYQKAPGQRVNTTKSRVFCNVDSVPLSFLQDLRQWLPVSPSDGVPVCATKPNLQAYTMVLSRVGIILKSHSLVWGEDLKFIG